MPPPSAAGEPASPGAADRRSWRVPKTMIVVALTTMAIGQTFVFAILPPLGRAMGLTDVETGLVITISAVAFVLAAPLWGGVSERWGRRPVLVLGLAVGGIATAAFGAVIEARLDGAISAGTTFILLVASRIVLSATASGLFPVAQAYMADITAPEERAAGMALIGVAYGMGSIGGPGVAWTMASVSVFAPIYGVALLLAVAAVGAALILPEPRLKSERRGGGRVDMGTVVPFLMIGLFAVGGYGLMQQVTGLRLQDLFGLSTEAAAERAGFALMAMAVGMLLAQGLALRRLSWTPRRSLVVGGSTAIGAAVSLTVIDGYLAFVLAMAAYGVAGGFVIPANMAALSLAAPADGQGRIAGLNGSAQGLGMVVGPVAGAAAYQLGPAVPYLCAAAVFAAITLLAALVRVPDGRR